MRYLQSFLIFILIFIFFLILERLSKQNIQSKQDILQRASEMPLAPKYFQAPVSPPQPPASPPPPVASSSGETI